MKNQKLISVRVDPDALEIIDQRCVDHSYRNRSDYVNGAIRLMAWLIENGHADQVIRFHPQFGDVVDEFEFKYHREHR